MTTLSLHYLGRYLTTTLTRSGNGIDHFTTSSNSSPYLFVPRIRHAWLRLTSGSAPQCTPKHVMWFLRDILPEPAEAAGR